MMNATPCEGDYEPYEDRLDTYLVPLVFAVIFVAGVLGNGTLVLIFVRHRNMRSGPNAYILSLALGDLLVILTCVPITSTAYTMESWPFGVVVCKLSECAKDISVGVSVFTLTALSVERYRAISDPFGSSRGVGGSDGPKRPPLWRRLPRPGIPVILGGIWVLASLLAVPSGVLSSVGEGNITSCPPSTIQVCQPFPDSLAPLLVLARFVAYYALPLVVIGLFYSLMAAQLRRGMPGEVQQRRIRDQRHKAARTLVAFVVVFFVCFLPQHIFLLWFRWNPTSLQDYDDTWHCIRILGFCLSFANSCANPVALYCVSGTFRKLFNRYLFCWCGGGGTAGVHRDGSGGTSTSTAHYSSRRLQHRDGSTRTTVFNEV